MKYGVDLISLEAGNQPTRVLCEKGGKVDPRPRASSRTWGMIGSEPWVPVPMISKTPPQGSSSSANRGVMPERIAVWLRRLPLTFPHPATLDDDVVLVLPPSTTSIRTGVIAPACRHLQVGHRPASWRRPPLPIVHIPATIPLTYDTRGVALAGGVAVA
jgi:hypothetical protein